MIDSFDEFENFFHGTFLAFDIFKTNHFYLFNQFDLVLEILHDFVINEKRFRCEAFFKHIYFVFFVHELFILILHRFLMRIRVLLDYIIRILTFLNNLESPFLVLADFIGQEVLGLKSQFL